MFVFAVAVETIEGWLLLARDGDPTGTVATSDRRHVKRLLYRRESSTWGRRRDVALPIVAQADPEKLRTASKSVDLFVRELLAARARLASPND